MIQILWQMLFPLLIGAIALTAFVLPNGSAGKCKAPSKRQLENILSQPVACPPDSDEAVCFSKDGALVIARFEPSGVASSIVISTHCVGISGLRKIRDQIVPEKRRGKLKGQVEKSEHYACQQVYTDEYECLSIKYSQNNCQGCVPAAIEIVWKHRHQKASAA